MHAKRLLDDATHIAMVERSWMKCSSRTNVEMSTRMSALPGRWETFVNRVCLAAVVG